MRWLVWQRETASLPQNLARPNEERLRELLLRGLTGDGDACRSFDRLERSVARVLPATRPIGDRGGTQGGNVGLGSEGGRLPRAQGTGGQAAGVEMMKTDDLIASLSNGVSPVDRHVPPVVSAPLQAGRSPDACFCWSCC